MPNGYSSGNCGYVENALYNKGGGVAKSVVTIAAWWYSGGMYKAYYGGFWINNSTGSNGGISNANFWSPLPSFNWQDPQSFYTDTGNVTVTIDSEAASTTLLGECTLVNSISATDKITL
jgi:hypothetical protein